MQQDQTQELDLKHGVEQGRVFLENEKRGRKRQEAAGRHIFVCHLDGR